MITPSFNSYTCETFVKSFNDRVLSNTELLYKELATKGQIDSLDLTQLIGVARPSDLPFVLTTPLERRTRAIGLGEEFPWTPDKSPARRTMWRDRDGIAKRMLKAIEKEQARRAAQKP